MKKKRLKVLAHDWLRRSQDDDESARSFIEIKDQIKAMARTRRNCAWELLRLLNDAEKENPAKAGLVSAPDPDCESA